MLEAAGIDPTTPVNTVNLKSLGFSIGIGQSSHYYDGGVIIDYWHKHRTSWHVMIGHDVVYTATRELGPQTLGDVYALMRRNQTVMAASSYGRVRQLCCRT